ncbi:MAG: pilus assembly protein [Lachnospiraceae bacterium]|nr:pilus assembly protein [Lachnospiraceae bacterium]
MFFSKMSIIFFIKFLPLRVQAHIYNQKKKRTSQSASGREELGTEAGSATVEAALIVPLLLCVFIGILLWGKVFLFHQEIETALLETARQLARQEALLALHNQEGTGVLTAPALFQANRKQGDGTGGMEVSSVRLIRADYRKETKEIYLKAEYVVKIPLLLLGTWRLPFKTSVVQKAWNGYTEGQKENTESEYVYVTAHGTAYHKDSQCYHLHVTIREVDTPSDYYEGRTSYRPCEFCVSGEKKEDSLYISEDGECYHESDSCGGLTRTVSYVELGQADGRMPCADCCGG